MFRYFLKPILLCGICITSAPLLADINNEEEICLEVQEFQDKYGLLRSMSLAVRGTLPEMSEYEGLANVDAVPELWLDEWFASEAFAKQTQRFFDNLLWPNITNNNLFVNNALVSGDPMWRRGSFSRTYRGSFVGCDNVPAEFDPQTGAILTHLKDGNQVEGYVMVSPYWAPDTQIKVCAFDAQINQLSPSGNRCDTTQGNGDAGCGCGPDLRWCATGANSRLIAESIALDFQK